MKSTKPITTAAMDTSTLTMESLALPRDLYWDGKTEPISPPSSELFSITTDISENWLYDDNFANGLTMLIDDDYNNNNDDDDNNIDIKSAFEVSYELVNGDDLVIELGDLKKEYLLDTKLPPYLDYPIGIEIAQPHIVTKVQLPVDIGAFGATNFDTAVLAQLTPPQSPPQSSAASPVYQQNIQFTESHKNINHVLSGIASPIQAPTSPIQAPTSPLLSPALPATIKKIYINNAETIAISNNNNNNNNAVATTNFNWNVNAQQAGACNATTTTTSSSTSSNNNNNNNTSNNDTLLLNDDIARQMQLVDEIVSTRAKELSNWSANEECETQSSYSAPSQTDSIATTDDDWSPPESCYSSSVASPLYQHNSSDDQMTSSGGGTQDASLASLSFDGTVKNVSKKRTRPYGRGVEDRKIRKKEQNKNAATRYRQKKKVEMEIILTEEHGLLKRNEELKRILSDTKREAKYLKSLIREFYQNRKKSA